MTLEDLVERYGINNSEMNRYKKLSDADNKEIKATMLASKLGTCESENFIAKVTVPEPTMDFDEEKLISKLRGLNPIKDGKYADEIGLIEYIPRVNMDVLENLMYQGIIKPADLADCRVKREGSPRLTISKKKEKKNNEIED